MWGGGGDTFSVGNSGYMYIITSMQWWIALFRTTLVIVLSALIKGSVLISGVVLYASLYIRVHVAGTVGSILIEGDVLISSGVYPYRGAPL